MESLEQGNSSIRHSQPQYWSQAFEWEGYWCMMSCQQILNLSAQKFIHAQSIKIPWQKYAPSVQDPLFLLPGCVHRDFRPLDLLPTWRYPCSRSTLLGFKDRRGPSGSSCWIISFELKDILVVIGDWWWWIVSPVWAKLQLHRETLLRLLDSISGSLDAIGLRDSVVAKGGNWRPIFVAAGGKKKEMMILVYSSGSEDA